jgi:sugar lactone lactonase YvrE
MITAKSNSVKGHFMKFGKAFLFTVAISTWWLSAVFAQIYDFTTIAGSAGTSGSTNGLGTVALFNYPTGVVTDTNGNVYVADYGNSTIREIIPLSGKWHVTTVAGAAGIIGSDDGRGTNALFNYPMGIAIDTNGILYVADHGNSTIREIIRLSSKWEVTTIAGTAGSDGSDDGLGSAAQFYNPAGVAVDSAGNVYVADYGNHTIRQLTFSGTDWVVSTIAGKATKSGTADGTGSSARFENPAGVAVDSAGNVYVADYGNNIIRKITLSGTNWMVSTIAGLAGKSGGLDGINNSARFDHPIGLAVDANNNLYVADAGNSAIRKITPTGTNWVVTTIAGIAGKAGKADGTGSSARFNGPLGITVDSDGNVYVADTSNQTIRQGLAFADTFVSLQGVYNGLAIQTNVLSLASSGSLKLVLTETGSFTANLTLGGTRLAFGGLFDESGNATNTVTGHGLSSWEVILHLDLTGGTEEITGTVSQGGSVSQVLADLATFSKANPCLQAGVYTFVVMPPSDSDSNLPQGWGFGTLKVANTGIGKLSGTLGDGTKFKSAVPISKYGTAPLYSLLYGKKGLCAGWLNFSNDTIEATVDWIKPSVAKGYYTGGFTTNTTLLGSKYLAPAAGQFMIDLTNTAGNAMLAFGGGNLGSMLSNSVTVASDNTVTILSGGVTSLTLKLAPKNGTFSGTFLHPLTNKKVKFQGVVLQLQDFGAGFFTGANETGYVTISPVE